MKKIIRTVFALLNFKLSKQARNKELKRKIIQAKQAMKYLEPGDDCPFPNCRGILYYRVIGGKVCLVCSWSDFHRRKLTNKQEKKEKNFTTNKVCLLFNKEEKNGKG